MPKPEKKIPVSTRITPDLDKRLEDKAKAERRTKQVLIEMALESYLARPAYGDGGR